MLGVILTGHGRFASGLHQAACQIVGEQAQFVAIDFPDGKSSDDLEAELRAAVESCDQGQGVVFMTDILGGSPFRYASLLSMEKGDLEVITGTNMQMLIEMLMERDELSPSEFREMGISSGVRGITSLWHESQKKRVQEVDDDGI
jgi:PTS system N-acetylgalactosamine-specific IIA component